VQCWGFNDDGELGNGTTTSSDLPSAVTGLSSNATAVATGTRHTCAIVAGGARCWGYNSNGELGDGLTASTTAPVAVTGLSSGVTAIAAGGEFTCAVINGGAQCWGDDSEGELGNGVYAPSASPVAVVGLGSGVIGIAAGSGHACALVNTDATHPVKCWGADASGQLGNNSTIASFSPVDVAFSPPLNPGDSVAAIAANGTHSCARVIRSGVVRMECWGDNEYGELGVAGPAAQNLVPATVTGLSSGVTAISTGSTSLHNCAVVAGGLQCWGSNQAGELGNGIFSASSIAQPVIAAGSGVTANAAGFYHNCVIINGGADCFGGNGDGELGNGTTTPSIAPMSVTGLGAGVTAIAAGGGYIFDEHAHTCAIVSGGAQCWGANDDGQLGNGSTSSSSTPVAVTGLTTGATAIAVGGDSIYSSTSCAVVNNGARCWGSNNYGQLGNGTMAGSATAAAVAGLSTGVTGIAVGKSHACAIVNGGVQCWGANFNGQLGNGTLTNSSSPVAVSGLSSAVTAIAAGANHTCAIVSGGVQCWGYNLDGELGNGTTAPSTIAPVAAIGLSSGVVAISAGYYHTCALLNGGAEKCWGSDQYGQLGDHRLLTALLPQTVVAGDEIFHNGFDGD
jgi:alpha-tubulin suppressor-like RCC1 family protein